MFGKQNYGVGYLAPENCDDIEIMCEYKRTPSFYNLKKAYAQVHAENITMDEFEPIESRTGRSTCPSQFPKLSSFHWRADWKMSSFCPPRSHKTWTCPASGGNATVTTPPQSFEFQPLPVFFITAISCMFVKLLWRKRSMFNRSSLLIPSVISKNWVTDKGVESGNIFTYEASGLMNAKDSGDDYFSISSTFESS